MHRVWMMAVVVLNWAGLAGAQEQAAASGNAYMGTLQKLIDLAIEFTFKYSFQVLGGVIVLGAGWLVSKFVCKFVQGFLTKHKIDVTVSKFLVGAVRLIIMAFAGLIALGKFGIEIAPFIAGLSVVGFGTSFALQGPLSNYAAGATLIFTKPFKVGDIIEVVGVMGEVQDMTLPRTVLKTIDGTTIVVPNKHIIGEIIHNFADSKRLDIKVGVSYKADIDKAIRIVKSVVEKEPRVLKNPLPKIGVSEFGDSSVNIYARIWSKQDDYWDAMFAINRAIFEEFGKGGVEIPFPQRDVHLFQHKA